MSLFGERTKKIDYFDGFVDLLDYADRSIDYLDDVLHNFDPDEKVMQQKMEELHAIEHAADKARHQLISHLVKEFITPIEREDIMSIVSAIDDITDSIEDVLQQIYMYNVKEILPEAFEFCRIIKECVAKLVKVYEDFHNFKKSDTIYDNIIALNHIEEEGDDLYIKAVRQLYIDPKDPVHARSWSVIFRQMESCCDKCETAGNLVEVVIMKNS